MPTNRLIAFFIALFTLICSMTLQAQQDCPNSSVFNPNTFYTAIYAHELQQLQQALPATECMTQMTPEEKQ